MRRQHPSVQSSRGLLNSNVLETMKLEIWVPTCDHGLTEGHTRHLADIEWWWRTHENELLIHSWHCEFRSFPELILRFHWDWICFVWMQCNVGQTLSIFCIFISIYFTDMIVTASIISREQWRGDTVTRATKVTRLSYKAEWSISDQTNYWLNKGTLYYINKEAFFAIWTPLYLIWNVYFRKSQVKWPTNLKYWWEMHSLHLEYLHNDKAFEHLKLCV